MRAFKLITHKRQSRESGFTLIEAMVTVAIIGVLAAIAAPAYTAYVTRSKLTEAGNELADMRIKMEQSYQDNRKYGTTDTHCGPFSPAMPIVATTGNTYGGKYFEVFCTTATPYTTFTLTASSRPSVGLGAEGAYVYTINQLNAKTTTKFKGATVAKTCWTITGSEC